ncbi:hypothetical protein KDA_18520 [Dictyobacter alpinus]|uniref:Uncharacterized protein n=1 Tax=Dictyobacter alpinus TaxID=2014873 RepID=A0A402B4U8_9CHLR|nr:hypothetical protein KDA_18520 [Dictyobacter alpinus]
MPVYVAIMDVGLVVLTTLMAQFRPVAVTLVNPSGSTSKTLIVWLSGAEPGRLVTLNI